MTARTLRGLATLLFAGMIALAVWNLKAAAARCSAVLVEQQERGGL